MKKKLKIWEKIFIRTSIFFIIGCILFYGYRLVYFYRIEHPTILESDKSLLTAINMNNNLVVKDDGLYKIDDNNYYFKGINLNNYVYLQGRTFQIVSINKDSIRLIATDSQSSIVWGLNNNYEESYIKTWLSDVFMKSLDNFEDYLVKEDYCYDSISLDNITCNKTFNEYVGLLSIKEYLQSGGTSGFINNNTYWWTNNSSKEKVWYIFPEGGINDNSNNGVTYHSYGIRPVINLKKDINIYSGTGSIDDPFVLDDTSKLFVGNYIEYSNHTFKIMEKNDTYLKVILDEPLKADDTLYKTVYDKSKSLYSTNNVISKYLNTTFYNSLDKTSLKKCDFNVGSYTNYDYRNTSKTKVNTYVGISSIGELFSSEYADTWLSNNIDTIKLTAYKNISGGRIYADDIKNTNYIRPIICLDSTINFNKGNGTKTNPFKGE